MKWEEIMPSGASIQNIEKYRDELKQLAIKSTNLGENYKTKLEAFKLDVFIEFKSILEEKNIPTKIISPTKVIAQTPTISIQLWEEQEEDDHLLLNFRKSSGEYWGFAIYLNPIPPELKRLSEFSTWYVDEKGELQTFKDTKDTEEYYKNEVEKVSNLVQEKELLSERTHLLKFEFSVWQDSKELGSFKTFRKALDFTVEKS